MTPEQQSWIALAVVTLTAGIFALRFILRKKSRGSCGGSCACPPPPGKPLPRGEK